MADQYNSQKQRFATSKDRLDISRFREIIPDSEFLPKPSIIKFPMVGVFEVVTVKTEHTDFSALTYKAVKINLDMSRNPNLTDDSQGASYIFGIILCMLPGTKSQIISHLKSDIGPELIDIMIPDDAGAVLIEIPETPIDDRKACVIFGYIAIVLFKTINDHISFERYMQNHLRALCDITRLGQPDESVKPFANQAQLSRYRSLYGACRAVKMIVLEAILEHKGGVTIFSKVCDYVARVLAWNEMSGFKLINETLVIPKSPVIKHLEICWEMMNFEYAYKKVFASTWPQYFRIFCKSNEYFLLNNGDFPVLLAVARKIQSGTTRTPNMFQASTVRCGPLVQYLYDLHVRHFSRLQQTNLAGSESVSRQNEPDN